MPMTPFGQNDGGEAVAHTARIDPRLTPDDLLQPHDFPALAADAGFNYEDGVLAGQQDDRDSDAYRCAHPGGLGARHAPQGKTDL